MGAENPSPYEVEKTDSSQTISQKLNAIKEDLERGLIIDNTRKTLDVIEKLDNQGDKTLLTNFLLGVLENKGFSVVIQNSTLQVETKKTTPADIQFQNNLQTKLNQYPNLIDTFKKSIVQRTPGIHDYIVSNTDQTGKIDPNVNPEFYYDSLVKKYNITFPNSGSKIDTIKNDTKIDSQEDKAFMVSYLQKGYDNFAFDKTLGEIQTQNVEAEQKIASMPNDRRETLDQQSRVIDGRSLNQRSADFLRNPFHEMNLVMGNAGGIGGLAILGAIIYFTFKKPKEVFGAIAGWGLLKGLGVMDELGNGFENTSSSDIKKRTQSIIGGSLSAYNFTVEKTEELGKKLYFWYDYSNIEFGNKDIRKSDFMDIYNKCDKSTPPNLTTLKDTLRHKKNGSVSDQQVTKLNNQMITLYNEGVAKFGDDSKFKTAITGKSLEETLAIIVKGPDTPTSTTTPASTSSSTTSTTVPGSSVSPSISPIGGSGGIPSIIPPVATSGAGGGTTMISPTRLIPPVGGTSPSSASNISPVGGKNTRQLPIVGGH